MERNTVTTIDQLQVGDRFYKANDKNKRMFQKVKAGSNGEKYVRTRYKTYSHFAKADKELHPVMIERTTAVVFIRNANS